MTHELKILSQYYQAVWDGRKTFEIRFDDRGYKVGDRLILKEWSRGKYTGRSTTVKVKYIYRGDGTYGIPENIVVMSLEELEKYEAIEYIDREELEKSMSDEKL